MEMKVSQKCKAVQPTTECSLKKGQNHKFRKRQKRVVNTRIEKGSEYKDRKGQRIQGQERIENTRIEKGREYKDIKGQRIQGQKRVENTRI